MKLIVKALMVDSNTEDREGFLWRERERDINVADSDMQSTDTP
jgi:hypothetical protein